MSGSDDNTLKVWDLGNGKCLPTFPGESGMRSCAAASDGRTFAAADASGRVHFLRLEGVD